MKDRSMMADPARKLARGLSWLGLAVGVIAMTSAWARAAPGDGDPLFGRLEAGYEHVLVQPNGETDVQGNQPGGDLRTSEGALTLHVAGGTRAIGHDRLGAFLSGQLLLDPNGPPIGTGVAALPAVTHRDDGSLLALHLAYAEFEGFAAGGALADMHLRAGRQFHWGLVPASFDGITVGYDGGRFALAARAGRRSAVYDPDPTYSDWLGGADVRVTVGGRRGLQIEAEYLAHRQSFELLERDRLLAGRSTVEQTSHFGRVRLSYLPDRSWSFVMGVLLADGLVDRMDIEVGYAGDAFELILEVRQKIDEGLAYDLALGLSPRFNGRATSYETLRLNIPDPGIYTDLQLTGDWFIGDGLVLTTGGGTRQVLADADLTIYDADQLRWEVGARAAVDIDRRSGLELHGAYAGARFDRIADPGGAFADPAAGGEIMSHLIEAGLRYVRGRRRIGGRLLAGRTLDLGVRAFYERWLLDNRYVDAATENSAGLAADGRVHLSRHLAIRASYEVARDTTLVSRWLEPLHAVRIGVSGRL